MASSSEPQETYDDFTRPGEEGFAGFPKHLPDDCVQYTIHVLNSSLSTRSALRSRLLEIRNAAVALQKSLLKDYIWQRESLDLAISPALDDAASVPVATDGGEAKLKDKEEEEMLHLRGKTSFGDSIADEWLIVYLLRELSLKFDDAWVRMWDADGEFLLVEAANALPQWMNPEVAEYRVWIHRGGLRIIPRYIVVSKDATSSNATSSTSSPSKSKVSQTPRVLTLPYALGYLERNTKPPALLHDSAIESEAFHRIRNYPADIASSMHSSLISIPRNLAYVLHRCPTHINPAIEAFYLRDPIALKPLRDVSEGTRAEDSLYFPPRDLVDVAVKFTKVGFAQLRGQEFMAPKLWRTAVSDSSIGVEGRQRREMGMKLSCGFEMLLSDPANRDQRIVREIKLLLEDLETGDEHLPTDAEIETWGMKVDDEAWLDVNFEQFEKELAGRGKGKAVPSDAEAEAFSGFGDRAAQENLRRMVKKFEELLEEDEMGLGGDDSGDEMDNDDDSDTDDGEDDDGGQEAAYRGEFGDSFKPFDEEDFKSMMKDLGLPMETVGSSQSAAQRVFEVDSDDEPIDAESIKKAMADMEAELKELGIHNTWPRDGPARDGSLIRKDPRSLLDLILLCHMRIRHRQSAVLNSKNMDGLLLLLARILFEASTVASQHTTSRDDANTKAKKPKDQASGTGNAMTDVALVVSVLATLICVVQVVQQYAVSGSPMRLCDSIVYGGSRGLPGRGRRRWVLSQFRYRIIYEMPRISLAPLNPRLGIFVPYLIKPSPSFDWPAPNHKLMSKLRKFGVQRTTGEAAWVSFSRLLNQVCPGSVIVNGVKGDADRCPLDMTVIPMPVSMRDMAFFALSVGMDCIDASFSSPSMTMSGPSGTITSSQHSLLGPILHYAPPQDGFELEKLGVKMDSAWILRVCGRIRVGNLMLCVGTDAVDGSHEEMSQQLWHENDITTNEASAKSSSEDTKDSWSTFEEEIKHLKYTNRHEGKCCIQCEYKDDRKCHHLCCNQCSADCGRQSPKKVAFKVDEKPKHSWSHRNYILSTTKIGQLNWYWLSQIPVTPGFWVTPFKSHVKVDVCWGAQATILQALYEMLARDTLVGVEQARKYTLDTIEMFCGFNHLSFPPYGSTRYGEPMAPDLIKEFAKRFEFVESLTFDSHIPLLQMHKGSRSPAAHGVLDNHRLWTIDVMSLDVWLNIAAKKEAIYAGMALIVKCVPSIVSEIMNTMGDDFAKVSCDGGRTVLDNAVAKLEEAVQTAGIACSRVELSHAEHMYVLVALLRTAKVGLCVGLGHDSTPLLKIIEKDVQAHLL